MFWTNQVLPLLAQRDSLNTSRSKDRTVSLFFLPKPLHSPHPLGSYIALPSSRSLLKTKMAKVCARSRRSNGKIGDCEQSTFVSDWHTKRVFKRSLLKTAGADNDCSSVGFDRQIRGQGRAFEHHFGPRGREFEKSSLQKFKFQGFAREGGGGMLKFRVDRRIRIIYILLIKRPTSLVHTKLPQNSPSQLYKVTFV